MTLQLARALLSEHDDDERWELLTDRQLELIWDEYGDEVEQFNRIVPNLGLAEAALIEGEEADVTMRFRGRSVPVPVAFDREDNLRAVYALSQLAREDLEFRLCRDTVGNSENAFLVLVPGDWQALESEFGLDAVKQRFLALAPSWDAFVEDAFAEKEEDLAPLDLAVKRFADSVEHELNRFAPCEVVRGCDEDNYVELTVITATDLERDRLYAEPGVVCVLESLVPALQAQGLVMRCVAIESYETANRDWHGLFMEPMMRASSPHFWFNRKPQDV